MKMKDIQSRPDRRKIPIQKVGIKDLSYPVTVLDRKNKSQDTVATVNMYVDLPHHFKGTHMSRFVELLNRYHGRVSIRELETILREMKTTFACASAHMEIRFPYFMAKRAPVSRAESLMDYQCGLTGSLEGRGKREVFDRVIEVAVPVTTVCPCSKEISTYGAHNQRSRITIRVRTRELVWFEELIEIAEKSASSPVYSLLKRQDEKHVTERGYERPRFVEDVVRGVAQQLRKNRKIKWYWVESENMESIHNHNAYALVTGENR